MSNDNGVIRIGRKGIKKFAFGDGEAFAADVVVAFQQWIAIDDSFRAETEDEGRRTIPVARMPEYHAAAQQFVGELSGCDDLTTAEALDFIARLREQYDELADFFVPRSHNEPDSPATSEAAFQFSPEEEPAQ